MRFFILLFVLGVACAKPVYDELEDDVLANLDSSLIKEYLTLAVDEGDDDIKTELGKKLKEHLDDIITKIKDAIDHGKEVKQEYLDKLKEIRDRLKILKIEITGKLKEHLDKLKNKIKEYWEKIKDLWGKDDKEERSADEPQTELGKKIREALDTALEHIKEHIDKGKAVKEELINKAKELREKLKEIKEDIGEKAKELLNKIKDKAKDFFQRLLDKLGGLNEKRAIDMRDYLKKLKEMIKSKIDIEALKEKIEKLFGKGSVLGDKFLEVLKEKGKKAKEIILDFIDRVLGEKEEEKRSLQELWDRVKEYFDKLKIQIKEKYFKFGEWVKEKLGIGLEKLKDHHERIKKIAQEMIDHSKEVGKDIAAEALDFLRPYKEDLGSLWEQFKESMKEVMNRKED